jgi:alanyl-tRNA synthetase
LFIESIKDEEEAFNKTLANGLGHFNKAATSQVSKEKKMITGEDAFILYDRFGFPLDLIEVRRFSV